MKKNTQRTPYNFMFVDQQNRLTKKKKLKNEGMPCHYTALCCFFFVPFG